MTTTVLSPVHYTQVADGPIRDAGGRALIDGTTTHTLVSHLMDTAQVMARATGSVGCTQVETVLGVEIRAKWMRAAEAEPETPEHGSTDTPVVCSECGKGNYRSSGKGDGTMSCDHCDHVVSLTADLDDAWYCWRGNVVLAYSTRTVEVIAAVRRATGYTLTVQDLAGGCFALGATLDDGRELLVGNGDAGLPDDEEAMAAHGGSLTFTLRQEDADEDEDGWSGNDIEELVEHIVAAVGTWRQRVALAAGHALHVVEAAVPPHTVHYAVEDLRRAATEAKRVLGS